MNRIIEICQQSNIEQRFVDGKGKCLFATVPFKKGVTIFEEEPLVCCQNAWNKYYGYLACDYCLRSLETVEENVARLTGNNCVELQFLELDATCKENHRTCNGCGEKYCSELCKTRAWNQYHQVLCHRDDDDPLTLLEEQWKRLHYPPEMLNIILLAKLVAMVPLAENKEVMYNQIMQFCHSKNTSEDESLIRNILGREHECNMNSLWQLFSTAMLSRCQVLGENVFVNSLVSMEGFITMLSLICRNNQGIATTTLGAWANKVVALNVSETERTYIDNLIDNVYSQVEKHVGSFTDNEGIGLYLMQSSINHSCIPNAKIKFPYNTNKLAVIAKRDIMPGEEIVTSYIQKCLLNRSCHTRRKTLKPHYLFTCMCPKCIVDSRNEPDVTSEEEEEEEEEDDEDDKNCVEM